jgi:ketosteroid isomerase-like protein
MQQAAARSSDEVAIRETVAAWSEAAGAKDLNKCVSFDCPRSFRVPRHHCLLDLSFLSSLG